MLSNLVSTLIFLSLSLPLFAVAECGVTYDFSGGRFGDCLMSYLHAKWLAYEKNIPLIYRSFNYSSQLVMSEKEKTFTDLKAEPRIRVYWGTPQNPQIQLPLLYICPYFPESSWELENSIGLNGNPWVYFKVNWKDPTFRMLAQEMISPKNEIPLIFPPEDRVSIAIHYRDGGDYDFDDKTTLWPLKFPPIDFYIEALRSAIDAVKGRPIYCFIFTDAIDRNSLVNKFKEAFSPSRDIEFDYRKLHNSPSTLVLNDFFSLFNFDILIRSESNYSLIPSLLHDYAIVYYPDAFTLMGNVNQITHTQVEVNRELYQRLLR